MITKAYIHTYYYYFHYYKREGHFLNSYSLLVLLKRIKVMSMKGILKKTPQHDCYFGRLNLIRQTC